MGGGGGGARCGAPVFRDFWRLAVLEAEGVVYHVLSLRFGGCGVLEAEGVVYRVLSLRFAVMAVFWGFLRRRAS